jgi:hypothetical protein
MDPLGCGAAPGVCAASLRSLLRPWMTKGWALRLIVEVWIRHKNAFDLPSASSWKVMAGRQVRGCWPSVGGCHPLKWRT